MISRTGSLALVLGLLTTATPSFAQDVQSRPAPSRPGASQSVPDALQSRPDASTPCANNACGSDSTQPPAHEAMPGRALPAQVISIDQGAGRVLLRTELGMVTVPASQSTIDQLSVGDVVMLRVVPDSDDSPSASPPGDESDDSNGSTRL